MSERLLSLEFDPLQAACLQYQAAKGHSRRPLRMLIRFCHAFEGELLIEVDASLLVPSTI